MKKPTNEDRRQAWGFLQQFRGKPLCSQVNSVAKSGMARRIEFYALGDHRIDRIGWAMATVLDYGYDVDKGGLLVKGCGMDMAFHVASCFNLAAWRMDNPDAKSYPEIDLESKHFFNAQQIQRL